MIGPAEDAGLEEGAIEDQLTPPFKEGKQAGLARGAFESVVLLDCQPRHAPARRGHRITGASQLLLLDQQLLARLLPLLRRYDRWRLHSVLSLLVSVHVAVHDFLLVGNSVGNSCS